MSDLAATNCGGCKQTTTSGGCNCMWIILILLFCGGWNNNDGCGCGGGNGFFGFTTTDWTWATGKVSKGRMPFYARELQSELQRRADEGDPVYDEDGSYMQLPDAYRVDYSNVVLKP